MHVGKFRSCEIEEIALRTSTYVRKGRLMSAIEVNSGKNYTCSSLADFFIYFYFSSLWSVAWLLILVQSSIHACKKNSIDLTLLLLLLLATALTLTSRGGMTHGKIVLKTEIKSPEIVTHTLLLLLLPHPTYCLLLAACMALFLRLFCCRESWWKGS